MSSKRNKAELKKETSSLDQLKALEKDHGKITLLYGAKDIVHNQAVVLKEVLEARK